MSYILYGLYILLIIFIIIGILNPYNLLIRTLIFIIGGICFIMMMIFSVSYGNIEKNKIPKNKKSAYSLNLAFSIILIIITLIVFLYYMNYCNRIIYKPILIDGEYTKYTCETRRIDDCRNAKIAIHDNRGIDYLVGEITYAGGYTNSYDKTINMLLEKLESLENLGINYESTLEGINIITNNNNNFNLENIIKQL